MGFIRLVLVIFQWAVMLGLTVLALYILSTNFNVFGGFQPYLVQSGSMEPSIMTGDVIVIHKKPTYEINDVVTFTNASKLIVTHRIIEVNHGVENTYSTKGDANRSGDDDTINENQIIGAVSLVIPKLGYLVAFAKSKTGILYMLLIPALVFILDELVRIKKNYKRVNYVEPKN
jgi:signal peptidase I